MTQIELIRLIRGLLNPKIGLWFAKEVFAGLPGDEAESFEFVIGALDFALVYGEFLREGGGRRKRVA